MAPSPAVLKCLQSGPLKLALVAILAWLGLFTVFISCNMFLRGPGFDHAVGVIPDGVVEQRVLPVSALQSLRLSDNNRRVLSSFSPSTHITFTFDTTSGNGPTINRFGASRSYSQHIINKFGVSISARSTKPWNVFGLRTADAVMLNDLVYGSWKTFGLPSLTVYAWLRIETNEREIIHLSLFNYYHPGEEFATIVRTRGKDGNSSWEILLVPATRATAPSRAFPIKQTLALFLWPVLFHNFLGEGGMAGVVLLWVCLLTTGYACITVGVAQWVVRSGSGREGGEVRRGQGAALRWEEEGWAIMNAVDDDEPSVRISEDAEDELPLSLLKDQV